MKYLIRSHTTRNGYGVSKIDAINICEYIFTGSLADCYAFVQFKRLEDKSKIELSID